MWTFGRIYRDLRLLDTIAPITNTGKGTGYRFMGKFFLYPLNFSEQEALVFSLLPSMVDEDKLPPGFHTAYDKVMSTHHKEKSQQNNIIEDITNIIQMGTPAYRKESTNFLQPIIQAILEQKTIETTYHTQYRNETTERKIDPYYLVPRDQRFYLIGFCHAKQDIRTFRISRFLKVDSTNYSTRVNLILKSHATADSVIIPVQAHYLPAKGMTQLLQTIARVLYDGRLTRSRL